MRSSASIYAVSTLVVSAILISGCASNFDPLAPISTPVTPIGNITGSLYGGHQPIVGAQVYLFAANTSAYGGNGITPVAGNLSTSLLAAASNTTKNTTAGSPLLNDYYITTDANGAFTLTGDYSCTQNTQVYVYSVGGNPGAGVNSGAGLMAILGNCPSGGSLATQTPHVYMNEVSTIAAAYAFAGFASDAIHVGTTGSTLAKTGIQNAFANAAQMYNIQQSPYANGSLGALAVTPGNGTNGGTGTVPQKEINSLANILAQCIDSSGPTQPACLSLFRNATSDGVICATTCSDEPTDTATAAINIAHHPAEAPTTLYNIVGSNAVPYSLALSAAPNDWSVQLSFTGGGLTTQYTNGQDLAVDGSGNIWVANSQGPVTNQSGTTISKFSPLGVPANANGYTGGTNQLSTPAGLAISADSAHVWIGNYDHGSVVDFNVSAGTGTEHTLPNGEGITALAFDSSGNLWGADYNIPSLVKLSSGGSQLAYYTGNGVSSPFDLAIAPTASGGKIWVAEGGGSVSAFSSTGGAVSNPSNPAEPTDVAMDSAGNAWFVTASDTSGHTVWKMNASGSGSTSYAVPGASGSNVWSDAMDGGDNLWVTGEGTNVTNNRIWAVNSSGVTITGATVGLAPAPANTTQPSAIAVDGSGNVWYTSSSDATLHEIVGAGVPVVTPVSVGTVNNTLGTRP